MSQKLGTHDGKEKNRKGGKSKSKRDALPYQAKINSEYQKHTFKTSLETAFAEKAEFQHESKAVLFNQPFQCCVLPNFVKDEQFLEGLKDELLDQIFMEKNNDLYKFQQTNDLKKISSAHVKALKRLIYGDLLDWMRDVTGIALSDRVDITCSRYEFTDVLLCHDDELDSRRIAFILYLVPPWKTEDGGCLDLFDMDEHGQPRNIVKSLSPSWNTLSWFEVTEASHHQVGEVFSDDKTRLSINGWFHAPPVPRAVRHVEARLPTQSSVFIEENVFREWINPIYLDPVVQTEIQEKFENDSEIQLQGFLQEEKYLALVEALKEPDLHWTKRGPPNKRSYQKLSKEKVPDIVVQCLKLFQSDAMFLTLSDLTGLSLHPLANRNVDVLEGIEDDVDCDEPVETCSSTARLVGCGECPSHSDENNLNSDKSKPLKKKQRLDCESEDVAFSSEMDTENSETSHTNLKKDTQTINKPCTANCRTEVRKWSQGSYTLAHDADAEGQEFALDAMLFCSCKGWQQECGGHTTYIAKGEDEELLTVTPADNALALVYRDKDTLKFVKHINCKVNLIQNEPEFYDISTVYFE